VCLMQAAVGTTLDEARCSQMLAATPKYMTPRGPIAGKRKAKAPLAKRQSVLPLWWEHPPYTSENSFRRRKAPPTKRQSAPPPPLEGGPTLHKRNPYVASVRRRQLNVSAPLWREDPP
ncbi:MAG: hypothetical protein ACKPKO_07370, partial [Candidatus Fonsibacter sp.]